MECSLRNLQAVHLLATQPSAAATHTHLTIVMSPQLVTLAGLARPQPRPNRIERDRSHLVQICGVCSASHRHRITYSAQPRQVSCRGWRAGGNGGRRFASCQALRLDLPPGGTSGTLTTSTTAMYAEVWQQPSPSRPLAQEGYCSWWLEHCVPFWPGRRSHQPS